MSYQEHNKPTASQKTTLKSSQPDMKIKTSPKQFPKQDIPPPLPQATLPPLP